MALSKPILNPIGAWDVAVGAIFTFNVIGGDQVQGNKLTIMKQSDQSIVYEEQVSSFVYTHTVPADAPDLTNDEYYVAYIQTVRTEGGSDVYSEPSNSIQFYCYTTPTFEFVDLPAEVPSSEYTFEATYSQEEGEELSTYSFYIYNINGVLIKTSGILYASNLVPTMVGDEITYDLSYTIQGLENTLAYYIELVGTTVANTQLTTGREYFVVNYSGAISGVLLKATNQCDQGNILIESFLDVMNGQTLKDPTYVENKEIDLRDNEVVWDDLSEQTDFSIRIVFRAPNSNTATLMTFEDDDGTRELVYHYNPTNKQSYCSCGAQVTTSALYGKPNDLIKYVVVVKRISDDWFVAWDVYEQPSGTLYTDNNVAKVDSLGTLTPDVSYSLDNDGNLIATYPDGYEFSYNELNGDITLTI